MDPKDAEAHKAALARIQAAGLAFPRQLPTKGKRPPQHEPECDASGLDFGDKTDEELQREVKKAVDRYFRDREAKLKAIRKARKDATRN
jgi:hypothetical protein